jgi:hypothetical protein
VIGVTGGSHTSALRHYSLAALIAVECGVFTLGAALTVISMHGSLAPARQGLLLGVAAGVLFGVSDIALKYLTRALHGGLHGLVSPWTLTAFAASVVAFYTSARGLQLGPGVEVIAFTSVAANLAAIVGGILVFRDPIGIGGRSPPLLRVASDPGRALGRRGRPPGRPLARGKSQNLHARLRGVRPGRSHLSGGPNPHCTST